jgi:hypothetical protein
VITKPNTIDSLINFPTVVWSCLISSACLLTSHFTEILQDAERKVFVEVSYLGTRRYKTHINQCRPSTQNQYNKNVKRLQEISIQGSINTSCVRGRYMITGRRQKMYSLDTPRIRQKRKGRNVGRERWRLHMHKFTCSF